MIEVRHKRPESLQRGDSMVDPIIESGQGGKETSSRRLPMWMILGLIVAASLAVRVAAWAHWRTGAIESEGAEYKG